jgi:serine/threonine protein kinase/Tfp pilus assembly protein PilF
VDTLPPVGPIQDVEPVLLDRIAAAVQPAYLVRRELGRGGAATVFLADDAKHGRQVALKVLDPAVTGEMGHDRFLREIRIAARLTHPHILPVLDSGVAGGLPFYVMPFVEGETLRTLLDRGGRLSLETAIRLTREVADALDYAHAAGIVHRDVKPENILLLEQHAVLADFGIARGMRALDDENTTMMGLTIGTPAYMSPEQAVGDSMVDGRSDEFSLAAVVYEMIAGAGPYAGLSSMAMIAQRFAGPPARIRTRRPEVPIEIDAALARALSLEPEQRFPSAGAFAGALSSGAMTTSATSSTSTTAVSVSVEPRDMPSIAVLPFVNASGDADMEFFSDGVADEIMSALGKLRRIRVAARSSCYVFRGKSEDARVIGERLGVANILEGSVRRAGTRVRVSAQLVSAGTGFQLWAEQYDRQLDDVFAIQDDIARAIVDTLHVHLLGEGERPLVVSTTRNASAHEAYLRATHASRTRTETGLRTSVDMFREALRTDPDLVPAHVGLADSLSLMAIYGIASPREVMPLARHAAEDALRRDPTSADAWLRLGSVHALYEHDWTPAEEAFRRAATLGPHLPAVHQRYALDVLAPRARFAEALAHIKTACELDPLSPVIRTSEAMVHYFAGDHDAARDAARAAARLDQYFAIAEFFIGTIARDAGDATAAVEAFTRAIALTGGTPEMIAGLAQTHARAGRIAEAESLRVQLTASASQRFVSPTLFAQLDLALGRVETALVWLAKAERQADPELIYLGVRPVYRVLEGVPAYRDLLQRVGLA